MKVGFLIYGDINTLSGGYLYDRKLISYLRQQGDTVEIISLPQHAYLKNIFFNVNPHQLTGLDLDILVQDELVHPSVFRANHRLKNQCHYPIVALVHLLSSDVPQAFYIKHLRQYIEKKYLASADALILNSNNTLEQTRELLGDPLPPHLVAVPAGNNFGDDNNTTGNLNKIRTETSLKILYVGSITRQKGLDVLVQSLSGLNRQDFHLTITGRNDMDPSYVRKIKRLINKYNLQNQIKFTGPLEKEALIKAYRSNHVLVLPSVNEAYGIVYLEAQRFGLPVIGTTAGGAKEIITHGKNGYLIIPNYVNELAHYLSMIQKDPALLQKLSKNARLAYQQHPTWDDSCHRIRRFLLGLLANTETDH
jgi:glycosyltransferase involved in cell wall biosynthesis